MKKGDLTTKAIGLAIAGVLAGSGLAMAAPQQSGGSNATAGDQKANDKHTHKDDRSHSSTHHHVNAPCRGDAKSQTPRRPAGQSVADHS